MQGSFLKPAPLDRKTLGKYELLSRLSTGGMSEIFLATQLGLAGFRKIVVLKSILPNIRGEEEFVRMFLEEARITSSFNHPNIAQVFDLDTDDEHLFLAMEFVQGATLIEVTRACEQNAAGLPLGFALTAIRDSALALHYAHTFSDTRGRQQPVIHRDVSGKNIMVTYEGTTKLLDFGIAKSLGAYRSDTTSKGMVKGTTGYMSPEQVLGEPLDPRSDIFSLAIVLHEALTGARLFARSSEEQEMRAVLNEPAQPPSRVNPKVSYAIDKVTLKALSIKREQRYASALEFARALEAAASGGLWHPEQLGELVQKLHADRLKQTHSLVQQAQGNTGEHSSLQPRHAPAAQEEVTGVVAAVSQVTTQEHTGLTPALAPPRPTLPTQPRQPERGVTVETPLAVPAPSGHAELAPEQPTLPALATPGRPGPSTVAARPLRPGSSPGAKITVEAPAAEPRASAPTQSIRMRSTPGATVPVEPRPPSPPPPGKRRTQPGPLEVAAELPIVAGTPAFRPDGEVHDAPLQALSAATAEEPRLVRHALEGKTSPSIQLPSSAAVPEEPPEPAPRRRKGRGLLLTTLLLIALGAGFVQFRPDLRVFPPPTPPAAVAPPEPTPVVEAPAPAPLEPPVVPLPVEVEPDPAPAPVAAPAPAEPPGHHAKVKATKGGKKKKKGSK